MLTQATSFSPERALVHNPQEMMNANNVAGKRKIKKSVAESESTRKRNNEG
jgi:hypothetical protein